MVEYASRNFSGLVSKAHALDHANQWVVSLEARAGIEPAHRAFAELGLTTWLPRLVPEENHAESASAWTDRHVLRPPCEERQEEIFGGTAASIPSSGQPNATTSRRIRFSFAPPRSAVAPRGRHFGFCSCRAIYMRRYTCVPGVRDGCRQPRERGASADISCIQTPDTDRVSDVRIRDPERPLGG